MKKKQIVILFLIIEILSYLFINIVKSNYVDLFRYIAILLCFVYVFLVGKKHDGMLLTVAFISTIIADAFLFVIDDYYVVGVSIFCIAQFIYFYRLAYFNKKMQKLRVIIYFVSLFMAEVIIRILLKESFDLLSFVVIIYAITLLNNIVNSLIFIKTNYLFTIGLVLFGCCDVFVGIYNLSNQSYGLAVDLAWVFYIPSQVLIALSVNSNQKKIA